MVACCGFPACYGYFAKLGARWVSCASRVTGVWECQCFVGEVFVSNKEIFSAPGDRGFVDGAIRRAANIEGRAYAAVRRLEAVRVASSRDIAIVELIEALSSLRAIQGECASLCSDFCKRLGV